jgi:hypothetical protein
MGGAWRIEPSANFSKGDQAIERRTMPLIDEPPVKSPRQSGGPRKQQVLQALRPSTVERRRAGLFQVLDAHRLLLDEPHGAHQPGFVASGAMGEPWHP